MTTIRDLIGDSPEESYLDFDLSEIQQVLNKLQIQTAVDLPQAEDMQRMCLRGADVISDYIGKMVKTIGYLEAKSNKILNKSMLDYELPKGKTTAAIKKIAAEASDEVELSSINLSRAKAVLTVLNKKYDILIKQHHFYKNIAENFNRTIMGFNNSAKKEDQVLTGWE